MSIKIPVTYFFRKPQAQYFSIEKVFEQVIQHLPEDINVREYKLKNGTSGWRGRVKALLEVRRNKGVINHITGDITFAALALPKKGLVITYHDLESLAAYKGFAFKILKWLWITIPVKRAEVITTISEHTKQRLMEWTGCSADKIKVIHNPLPNEIKAVKANPTQHEFSILIMGTKANKNVEGILEAIYKFISTDKENQTNTNPSLRVIIVGKLTDYQNELIQKYQLSVENLVHVPYDQIIDAYVRCDLLCFPSFFEGFGVPIIEAQAIGRPVITSNLGAMKEVAGDSALLVNPNSVDEIQQAIDTIYTDDQLRNQLIEKGFENAKHFNPHYIAEEYAQVYRQMVLD